MARKKTDISFKAFWDAYGLKLDRVGAEPAWNRLSDKDRRAALAGIAAYREACRSRGVNMMYARGYLNHRRWEDEFGGANEDAGKTANEPTGRPDGMQEW